MGFHRFVAFYPMKGDGPAQPCGSSIRFSSASVGIETMW
jgi:hypothetical protein